MAWFLDNSDMLDTMADLASNPEKLAAFKADPRGYLSENTTLDEASVSAIVSEDHETVIRALMSKVGEDEADK